MTPGDGSAAVPSEPRRWTIYVCKNCGRAEWEYHVAPFRCAPGLNHVFNSVTVEEVGPVSEAEVEAGARALAVELGDVTRSDRASSWHRDCARAVLSAAREVKSDGD